ncbi:MAG: phosphoribosyl-AMP cyclohydrolase [Actinomycetaceae bacterium]|nr:phosphoribosyl-AMP cyclohydrolase [Actinomycetaceae bacterium]
MSKDELSAQVRKHVTFNDQGLVTVVVQDINTKTVLMVAYMNDTALARTLSTGRAWYWSRSRQEYWRKGDTSGHIQIVHSVHYDCDGDALLLIVEQVGVACHLGQYSCFDTGQLELR